MPRPEKYSYQHQKLRKQWALKVERGQVWCADPRCGFPIEPGTDWDLGHDPFDGSRYWGPEHASCNRSTALEKRLAGGGKNGFRWTSPAW